jgi:AcrR family transcriptional regulator
MAVTPLTQAAIYHQFPNKNELYPAVLARQLEVNAFDPLLDSLGGLQNKRAPQFSLPGSDIFYRFTVCFEQNMRSVGSSLFATGTARPKAMGPN